ncbi:MAG: hypothetical protein K2I07_01005, partial [Lachnospiraceae bacterium]|nr:hypothetical protein [Lachnospiraceae bacterium]
LFSQNQCVYKRNPGYRVWNLRLQFRKGKEGRIEKQKGLQAGWDFIRMDHPDKRKNRCWYFNAGNSLFVPHRYRIKEE